MTQEDKKLLFNCYNAVKNKVNEINDFVKLLKYFNGSNLQPVYVTYGPRRELIGNVGMQFNFAIKTNVGILVFTLFANDGDKDLELWDKTEFYPTEQSERSCLLRVTRMV